MILSTQEFRSGDDWLEQAASIGELPIEALARRASEWFFLKTTRLRVVLVFVGERLDLAVAIAAPRHLTCYIARGENRLFWSRVSHNTNASHGMTRLRSSVIP